MANNVKKITMIGLMVLVLFCMVSCWTVGSLASGLISSGSSSSKEKESSADQSDDLDPSKPGWQQKKDGSWVYVQGEGRAIPKSEGSSSSSDSGSSSSASVRMTSYFYVKNDLSGRAEIRQLYVSRSSSSSWGSSILGQGMLQSGSKTQISIPSSEQNEANRFNIKAVTDKGVEYTLSNVTIADNGDEVVFK